ncbi:MAG: hypothetical protein IKO86_06130, partial [Prevotella sp.]|nr:hypothetical protein [Prevotella sp.]
TSHVSYSFLNFGCKTTMFFGIHRYAKYSSLRNKKRVTIWQPNSFTNLPKFAIRPKLDFLVFPLIAFILGRNALIFPNRFAFTSFFRNFGIHRTYLALGNEKKIKYFFCISLVFS